MSSAALQRGVVDALKDYAPLTALVSGRVYDIPPVAPAFPYVTVGEDQLLDAAAQQFDAFEAFITIHIWSRTKDYGEAKQIADVIIDLFRDETGLSVSGHELPVLEFRDLRSMRDPDGLTSHLVLAFRGILRVNP